MRSKVCFTSSVAAGAAFALALVQLAAQDSPPDPPTVWPPPAPITSGRPLADVIQLLQARFARPVTYEEPVWVHADDLQLMDPVRPARGLMLKRRTLDLSVVPGLAAARKLDRGLVEAVTTAYVNQNSTPVFRVESSSHGLHVIPSSSRDAAGNISPQPALLDTVISIPAQTFQKVDSALEEICKAVGAAAAVRIDLSLRPMGSGFSQLYDAGRPPAFSWEVDNQPARDAMVSLLERSATTFTWRFLCSAGKEPDEHFCVLGVVPLELTVRDRSGRQVKRRLQYDRRPYSGPGPMPPPPPD